MIVNTFICAIKVLCDKYTGLHIQRKPDTLLYRALFIVAVLPLAALVFVLPKICGGGRL